MMSGNVFFGTGVGRAGIRNVKNWRVCAIQSQIDTDFEQKQHLCAFFGRESRENEQALHNPEKLRRKL
jgi:hypothetical protein